LTFPPEQVTVIESAESLETVSEPPDTLEVTVATAGPQKTSALKAAAVRRHDRSARACTPAIVTDVAKFA
jgi:hypothetical protein